MKGVQSGPLRFVATPHPASACLDVFGKAAAFPLIRSSVTVRFHPSRDAKSPAIIDTAARENALEHNETALGAPLRRFRRPLPFRQNVASGERAVADRGDQPQGQRARRQHRRRRHARKRAPGRCRRRLNVATTEYLGETWTFLDCPGFIELAQDAYNALMVVDLAVVVCEPEPQKVLTLAPLLRFLDDRAIPHIVFINKMDLPGGSVRATLEALQGLSDAAAGAARNPDPRRREDQRLRRSGQRARLPLDGGAALRADPAARGGRRRRGKEARAGMLEAIADFDDALLEKLLEDVVPNPDEIYAGLARDLQQDLIVPVFFGSAEGMHGITRLLKALRHEAPEPAQTAERLGILAEEPCARHLQDAARLAHRQAVAGRAFGRARSPTARR